MRCSTNRLSNVLVVFYALSKFEYIISDVDIRRGKGASADSDAFNCGLIK